MEGQAEGSEPCGLGESILRSGTASAKALRRTCVGVSEEQWGV